MAMVSVLAAGVPAAAAEKEPRMPRIASRRQQEYDALGYDARKVFVALTRLKRAFARKDFDAFARLATYPLTINRRSGPVTVENAAQLAQHRALVFTTRHADLVKAQTFENLALKDEGAMVGDLFMISGTCTDGGDKPCEYGITTINVP